MNMTFNLQPTDLMGLPTITNLDDLSFCTRVSKNLLWKLARASGSFYVEVTIPKKNGGTRQLACPSKKMKALQAWILRNILEKVKIHSSATAFIKGTNIMTNILPHKNNNFVLCTDLKNFFNTIPYYIVYDIFNTLGYNQKTSYVLANICCYKGNLPQGGVTSPALSNIACINLDRRLSRLSGFRNIVYSRYADDMSFSANNPEKLIKSYMVINQIIQEEGFTINPQKTRLLCPGNRRLITGLIINDSKKVTIGREKVKIVRSAIYNLETSNLNIKDFTQLSNRINGWMSFLKSVDEESFNKLFAYREMLKCRKEAAPS